MIRRKDFYRVEDHGNCCDEFYLQAGLLEEACEKLGHPNFDDQEEWISHKFVAGFTSSEVDQLCS